MYMTFVFYERIGRLVIVGVLITYLLHIMCDKK